MPGTRNKARIQARVGLKITTLLIEAGDYLLGSNISIK